MSDQRIQYDEEMVGAGHPTKSDTLNRLALIEANSEGKGKYRYLVEQTSDPSTGADEGVLYAKDDGGTLKLYFRRPSDGEVVEVGGGWELVDEVEDTLSLTSGSLQNLDTNLGGTYDKDTHLLVPCGYLTDASARLRFGFFYQISDTQYRFRYCSNTTASNCYFRYQIYKINGLKGPIQRGLEAWTEGAYAGPPNEITRDVTISALTDYTSARVIIPVVTYFGWYDTAGSNKLLDVRGEKTSATNLRLKLMADSNWAATRNLEIPWIVVPL